MRLVSMLAAAVEPWFSLDPKTGNVSFEIGQSIRGWTSASCAHLAIGGLRVDTGWSGPGTLRVDFRGVAVKASTCEDATSIAWSLDTDHHESSVSVEHAGRPTPVWAPPDLDIGIGNLSLRLVRAETQRQAYAAWKTAKVAEEAAAKAA